MKFLFQAVNEDCLSQPNRNPLLVLEAKCFRVKTSGNPEEILLLSHKRVNAQTRPETKSRMA